MIFSLLLAGFLATSTPEPVGDAQIIEQAITKMESVAATAEKLAREGILPKDETNRHYDEIIDMLVDVTEMVKVKTNAYKFLNAKGIDKVIFPNLDIPYSKLRGQMLILLKVLFEVAPTTTDAVIPISTIDKLLDIFENDDKQAMKAHVLDILYIWLPKNPKAQVRVMKTKGLEPFYDQMANLDTPVISTILDLFNQILTEHIKVRQGTQKTKADSQTLQIYKQIGLIERMSTPVVCNGLLNIFKTTQPWSHINEGTKIIGPVLDLVKKMKPYCMNTLRRRTNALEPFKELLEYVQEAGKKEHLESLNLNVSDIKAVLEDYVRELKHTIKDEF